MDEIEKNEPVDNIEENDSTPIEEQENTEPVEHSSYHAPQNVEGDIKYHLTGMYQNWFLDYASYVILERAVPDVYDGLKPVQRRILHSMKELDDGRYNKVANVVGNTMKYHPHGDASIGDALVQLGQKEMLIDTQGNWGNILTGDSAAAPRYIEARLSKFALETVFNAKTTHWKLSYDGRNKEPINLPVKFPLLLAQGVEGIAVGLNSKILPHNFNELCDASIAYLKGEEFVLYPDFPTGGSIDVSHYNDGQRGGSVKIRSKIGKIDNKTLVISEVPYGVTVPKLIETILKANERGKIKIRKVEDITAAQVEILVHLQPGSSSDKAIDALYAFTDCEVSISPNACVIKDKKPMFTSVSDLLRISADHTLSLLKWELDIHRGELLEQLFYTSLEKIFIEERIYKDREFEQSKTPEEAIRHIDKRIEPFKKNFIREVTDQDLLRLLEIKMVRITRYDSQKADDLMVSLREKIAEIEKNLNSIVDYTIAWFENLKRKYGTAFPRKTELRNFETIEAAKVAEANEKLFINRAEGFIGTGLKKDEFLANCSDMDDVIIFYKDGKYKIVRVAEKLFIGTNILHIDIFKKNDVRTIYNAVYRDGKNGWYFIKRFAATGLARDKEYDLTQGKPGSKVIYFTANHNGEAEIINVHLKPVLKLKKMEVLKDFSELAVKGRQSRGNLLTKYEVARITLKQKGGSTLGGRQVWFDPDVLRLNYDQRGMYLGEFHSDDKILVITKSGDYYLTDFELTNHYEDNILRIEKLKADKTWSLAFWDADQNYYYAKRFLIEDSNKPQNFLGDNPANRIIILQDQANATFKIVFSDENREPLDIQMEDFIAVKGFKAKGKRLTTYEVSEILDITPEPEPEPEPEQEEPEDAEEAELTDEQETESKHLAKDETPAHPTATATTQADNSDIKMEINVPQPADSQIITTEDTEPDGQMSLF